MMFDNLKFKMDFHSKHPRDYNTSSSNSTLHHSDTNPTLAKRFYNYNPGNSSNNLHTSNSGAIAGIESGSYSLKSQYAFDRLNEREKDLFEEY
jgi:hypothetical protein